MGFWKRISELWGRCSLTDRIIAVFTAVLAVAAIYQIVITGYQLDTMRKDQRAWVSVIQKGPITLNVGAAPSEVLTVSNTGKSPAKHMLGHFYVEIVPNGEAPHFEEKAIHSIVLYGSMPPNLPQDVAATRRRVRSGGKPDEGEDDPYLGVEKTAMDQGKAWMAVHGVVSYDDTFGTTHWTKFCFWSNAPGVTNDLSSRGCTAYNDTDDK